MAEKARSAPRAAPEAEGQSDRGTCQADSLHAEAIRIVGAGDGVGMVEKTTSSANWSRSPE